MPLGKYFTVTSIFVLEKALTFKGIDTYLYIFTAFRAINSWIFSITKISKIIY